MPIIRWHGWAAKCRRCGKLLDLGEGQVAWEGRDEVKDSLDLRPGERVEVAITDACGCERRGKMAKAVETS